MPTHRYVSAEEDSARWDDFAFRTGDIVISTRSKSGTTWLQMICALLIFSTPQLPRPLGELSPWLDHLVAPRDQVYAHLAAQPHRRFIKTHTPLDGVPIDPRVTYLVVARHPLDMAVSLYHQGDNIDRERLRELTGAATTDGVAPATNGVRQPRPTVHEWLLAWIAAAPDPRTSLDSLPGVLYHLTDAWDRRDQPNVVLVHYADLSTDLNSQMRRIADQLGIQIPDERWPQLVEAATFASMRSNADELIPNRDGVLTDNARFFRQGTSGAGRQLLTDAELAGYHARVASLAPTELTTWLHRP